MAPKVPSTMLLAVAVAVLIGVQICEVSAQTCSDELANLNVCAPFVVPGASGGQPNAACCGALRALDEGCLCSTLRIAYRLPSLCNLTPVSCIR